MRPSAIERVAAMRAIRPALGGDAPGPPAKSAATGSARPPKPPAPQAGGSGLPKAIPAGEKGAKNPPPKKKKGSQAAATPAEGALAAGALPATVWEPGDSRPTSASPKIKQGFPCKSGALPAALAKGPNKPLTANRPQLTSSTRPSPQAPPISAGNPQQQKSPAAVSWCGPGCCLAKPSRWCPELPTPGSKLRLPRPPGPPRQRQQDSRTALLSSHRGAGHLARKWTICSKAASAARYISGKLHIGRAEHRAGQLEHERNPSRS